MPTNILRDLEPRTARRRGKPLAANGERIARLTAGRAGIRVKLAATPTADRIWQALPLYGVAETWGQALVFDTPVESGRDRTARINGAAGEIYFWVENDRIVVPFGATPISRTGECRLPAPCNAWATALDDVAAFRVVTPGEKVTLVAEPTTTRTDA